MSYFIPEQELFTETIDRVYQLVKPSGEVVGPLPNLSADELLSIYRWMLLGRAFSDQMVALQRQGRMGTFASLKGQEATSVGLAVSLKQKDWLVASYRENISYMVKGVPLLALMKQWGGHIADSYPCELNCPPFQIVLGSQTLHAVGVAQAMKYRGEDGVIMTALGDGATSEGDFHEALNFAGVFKAPVIFVIQNNGWAISTPRHRQSAAEYLADRGVGFGVNSYVVDGNDVLAVYQIVLEAAERARQGQGPTLIEAITYRLDAHTTADDPTKYRDQDDVDLWLERDPINRFRTFLVNHEMLIEEEEAALNHEIEAEIMAAVEDYEALPASDPAHQFEYVYAEMPPQLRRQQTEWLAELGLAT